MSANIDQMNTSRPQSILVIGCGLMGTSLALAIRQSDSSVILDGVEVNARNRELVLSKGVFRQVYDHLPGNTYDLAVLAVPVDVACELLPQVLAKANLVMDVCSVKQTICETAEQLGARNKFAPTHPMAGLATAGPEYATPELFQERPWLLIEGWPASLELLPVISSLGARVEFLETPAHHDEAMAIVSHAIHLVSLSAMLAYGDARVLHEMSLARLTGPAFRDITRLSGSPSEFWLSTLLANTQPVVQQLDRIIHRLQAFQVALSSGNRTDLGELLDSARTLHEEWKGEQS